MAILDPVDQQATALDHLFRAHRADLIALCRRRLGPGPDAEDAAHEAMLRAWRARSSLDEGREAWPWLATIAGNVCIDVQRRRATARAYVVPRADTPLGPEDHIVRGTHDGLLREALDQLAPARREALLLREVEDWDYGQIAAHQRKSPGSVRTAVTRARQELRDHVETIARSRDQWPLAGVMGGLVARVRGRVAQLSTSATNTAVRSSTRMSGTWESVAAAASSTSSQIALGGLLSLTTVFAGATSAATVLPSATPAAIIVEAPGAAATDGSGAAAGRSDHVTAGTPTDATAPSSTAPQAKTTDAPLVTVPEASTPAATPSTPRAPSLDQLDPGPVAVPTVPDVTVPPDPPNPPSTAGTTPSDPPDPLGALTP